MSNRDFVVKALPPQRLAELSATVSGQEEISPAVGPLFDRVGRALLASGAQPGTGVGYYLTTDDGMDCHAGFRYAGEPADGFVIGELPAAGEAVTLVHLGSMATIGASWQAVGRWLDENGADPAGPCREIYLETPMDDPDAWVTELQQPFVRR